ncbi:hypothetical protein OSB04_014584 [Centaurea solstitialis]|uniref:Uncharacterized protein n=1 Tax=Centaurea solstitialis TaxID=347529 RepID=A0AA38SYY9_9ASTR|nr:hypothetical protein OSB04_014584 [Centaurea solstitialis]
MALPNDVFNRVDSLDSTKASWDELKAQMRGGEKAMMSKKHNAMNAYEGFRAKESESLSELYDRLNKEAHFTQVCLMGSIQDDDNALDNDDERGEEEDYRTIVIIFLGFDILEAWKPRIRLSRLSGSDFGLIRVGLRATLGRSPGPDLGDPPGNTSTSCDTKLTMFVAFSERDYEELRGQGNREVQSGLDLTPSCTAAACGGRPSVVHRRYSSFWTVADREPRVLTRAVNEPNEHERRLVRVRSFNLTKQTNEHERLRETKTMVSCWITPGVVY